MRRDAAPADATTDPSPGDHAAERAHARLHASCVRLGGRGVVLLGPPGSGKSDLALRLIDGGAELVADDQLLVERAGDGLIGSAPEVLAGLLEVRGVGIFRLPRCGVATLDLVVRLEPAAGGARLPDPGVYPLLGVELPCVHVDPLKPSAAAAVRIAVAAERVA